MNNLGLVGEKLGHSISPAIHQFIFDYLKINGIYSLLEIDKKDSNNIIEEIEKRDITGFNVTVPYKEKIISQLDTISSEAQKIGAVNTVVLKNGKYEGYNTDYFGIIKMFEGIEVENKICYILGSGGAAKALIVALHDLKAKNIYVVTRDINNKNMIKEKFPYIDMISYSAIEEGDILVNATPVGMYPKIDNTPISENDIKKFKIAVDIIYNPRNTLFLNLAKKHGLTAINGLSMLIQQALKAEEIWQNKELSDNLYDELLKFLKGEN